jgi:hypothetical protein
MIKGGGRGRRGDLGIFSMREQLLRLRVLSGWLLKPSPLMRFCRIISTITSM